MNWFANRVDQDSAEPGAEHDRLPGSGPEPGAVQLLEPHRAVSVFDVRANVMTRLCLRKAIGRPPLSRRSRSLARRPRFAQTDEFFDPNTMKEIRLTINTRDLRTLHEKYLDNTYYTADVQWKGIRVRNAGVRSRGNSSRNDSKMALRCRRRSLCDRPAVSRTEVVRAQESLDRPVNAARAAGDDDVLATGSACFAALVLPPLHQQRVPGALHHPGIGRQRIPDAQPRRERRLSLFLPAAE